MAFDAKIVDQFGNPFRSHLDSIGGDVVTETGRSYTATLGSLNAEVLIDLNGAKTVTFDVRSAAANLTYIFEGMTDGTNYDPLPAFARKSVVGATISAEEFVGSVVVATTVSAFYAVDVAALKRIRIKISAYTSGNIVVAARASAASFLEYVTFIPTTRSVEVDGAANASSVLTLPSAGAGLFHYITWIGWTRFSTAALAGTGSFAITATNLPGTVKWRVGNLIAAGDHRRDVEYSPANPLKSLLAGTATTITAAAAGAAVATTGLCTYYVGA